MMIIIIIIIISSSSSSSISRFLPARKYYTVYDRERLRVGFAPARRVWYCMISSCSIGYPCRIEGFPKVIRIPNLVNELLFI